MYYEHVHAVAPGFACDPQTVPCTKLGKSLSMYLVFFLRVIFVSPNTEYSRLVSKLAIKHGKGGSLLNRWGRTASQS